MNANSFLLLALRTIFCGVLPVRAKGCCVFSLFNCSVLERLLQQMKRFVVAFCVLTLAGCEQARPPSPAVVAARTAKGTKHTNLETKIQPATPRAGETSIWELKVFDKQNKSDGTRKEWKFFNDLPQSSTDKGTTQVQMNAWLISKDRNVFLLHKPAAKGYGSFMTDWTIPSSGDYTLWVEYQPVVAKEELSFQDLKKAPALEVERARWDVAVAGAVKAPPLVPQQKLTIGVEPPTTVYSLDASDYGTRAPFQIGFSNAKMQKNKATVLTPSMNNIKGDVTDQSFTALSPDSLALVHIVGAQPSVVLGQSGRWRAWFSFSLDGKPYAAPVDLNVT